MEENGIPGWETDDEKVIAKEEMRDDIVLKVENLKWDDHPINEAIKLAFLVTKKEHNIEGTCMIARVPKGGGIAEHTHKAHDLIIPIAGKGKFWINGLGDFLMEKGNVFSIPPGISHRLYDVTEDIEILDVYIPAIL
jgi:quercetin dioxygenase-like cupin family protein